REDMAKGLEPDQCYYIQNEPQVRGIDQIDLNQLPPPDLAVEIDITRSSLNRFAIYKALGVPEIWRFDGQSLTISLLQTGEYEVAQRSVALSPLQANDFEDYLLTDRNVGENSLLRQFRTALRNRL
ncbi:MAG: Uma2 family endonuclease, partial [Phormidesmis sp.]